MYYKSGQAFVKICGSFVSLQIRANIGTNGAVSLLKIGASVTNCDSYHKLGQSLLQNRAAITNWGRYYKLGYLLQIEA